MPAGEYAAASVAATSGVSATNCHVLLEDSGRSCEIPATKVGEAEIEQSSIQRLRMIGFFSDPHCDLTVRDGLVEPAKLG